jgi:glutathione synthase
MIYTCQSTKTLINKPVIAFIVDQDEVNICDQKLYENTLFFKHKVTVRRMTLKDASLYCKLSESGELLYKDKEVVTVVYYRSGYSPDQYPSEVEWEARRLLEISAAIKAPSVDLQMLTFKKIQEVLSKESIWLEFNCPKELDEIKHFFLDQMWGFEELDESTQSIISHAKSNPELYVLKTQREGGGNNYFGEDIPKILSQAESGIHSSEDSSPSQKLINYSLMRRINAKQYENTFLRNNRVFSGRCVTEVGIFGTLLVNLTNPSREVLVNKDTGLLMRTKGVETNEGGVYGGYAFIDFPYLQ